MWLLYAILSSFFASVMTILMKVSLKNIDSTLATTIRVTLVFLMLWIITFCFRKNEGIKNITNKEWLFISLSSIATCLTWLFYFLALKKANVTKVLAIDRLSIIFGVVLAVIFLKEKITIMTIIGIIVLVAGGVLVVFG